MKSEPIWPRRGAPFREAAALLTIPPDVVTKQLRWERQADGTVVLQQLWQTYEFEDGAARRMIEQWRDVPTVDQEAPQP